LENRQQREYHLGGKAKNAWQRLVVGDGVFQRPTEDEARNEKLSEHEECKTYSAHHHSRRHLGWHIESCGAPPCSDPTCEKDDRDLEKHGCRFANNRQQQQYPYGPEHKAHREGSREIGRACLERSPHNDRIADPRPVHLRSSGLAFPVFEMLTPVIAPVLDLHQHHESDEELNLHM